MAFSDLRTVRKAISAATCSVLSACLLAHAAHATLLDGKQANVADAARITASAFAASEPIHAAVSREAGREIDRHLGNLLTAPNLALLLLAATWLLLIRRRRPGNQTKPSSRISPPRPDAPREWPYRRSD